MGGAIGEAEHPDIRQRCPKLQLLKLRASVKGLDAKALHAIGQSDDPKSPALIKGIVSNRNEPIGQGKSSEIRATEISRLRNFLNSLRNHRLLQAFTAGKGILPQHRQLVGQVSHLQRGALIKSTVTDFANARRQLHLF